MSKVISPSPVGLTSPERVATSLIFSPTVAVAVALVITLGPAFSTVVVSFSSEHDEGPALFVFGESPLYSATQTYFPAMFGVKLASYSPSPFTSASWGFFSASTFDVAFSPQIGSSSPSRTTSYNVKVIFPVASPPSSFGLIDPSLPAGPPVPGLWAVPFSVAVSVTDLPIVTGSLAWVVSSGVAGLTMKHSVALLSLDAGTPSLASPENSARKQYRPADVTVAEGDTNVPLELTSFDPSGTPPLSQSVFEEASSGPQRWNETVALTDPAPFIPISAWSWTSSEASDGSVGMFRPPAGIALGFPFSSRPLTGVVTTPEVHLEKLERTKSARTAVVDVEVRVSEATLPKHWPPRPSRERLMPPSKNSPSAKSVLWALSSNSHGDSVVVGLTIAQNSSPAPTFSLAQFASEEVARSLRFSSPQSPAFSPVVFLHVGSHL